MRIARVYDEPADGSHRVLVDRLWPRGMRRDDARLGTWLPEAAPSSELRRWYHAHRDSFDEFRSRYEQELSTGAAADALAESRTLAAEQPVTLVTAARDLAASHVPVLADLLAAGDS